MEITYKQLQTAVLGKGYRFYDSGSFNLNIVGVRSETSRSNDFDDWLLVAYRDQNFRERVDAYPITTDPGKPWLLAPLDPAGCAILIPGQYPGAYQIGIHGRSRKDGGYPALEQVGPMAYVRDNNRDAIIDRSLYQDPKKIFSGILKTNIHHAGASWLSKTLFKYKVDKFSAGCQVVEYIDHFNQLMETARQARKIHGNGFTYTLLEERDLRR